MAVGGHDAPLHRVGAGRQVIRQCGGHLRALDRHLTGGDIVPAVLEDLDLRADVLDLAAEVHLDPLRLLIELRPVLRIRADQLVMGLCRLPHDEAEQHEQPGHGQGESARAQGHDSSSG